MKRIINRLLVAATLVTIAWAGSAHAQQNTVYGQQAAASELYSYAGITAIGYQTLYACQYCYSTTAIGYEALRVSSGSYNTGIGSYSMYNSTSGYGNVGVGAYTMQNLGTGSYNVALGYNAGSCATVNGSNNIWINHCGLAKDANVIRIGTRGTQKFTQIAGIYNTKLPAGGGQFVMVNSKGQLGIVNATIHTNVVTQADLVTLRGDLAATKNMVYALQRDNAALKARLGVK